MRSKSYGNKASAIALAVEGGLAHAKDLPKEAAVLTTSLEKRKDVLSKLNAAQERKKRELKQATAALTAEMKQAWKERGRIVKYAEAAFGHDDDRLPEFRPATEGHVPRRAKPQPSK